MSTIVGPRAVTARPGRVPAPSRARAYFCSDAPRTVQSVLALIWLLVGGLQFQSYMYGRGFIEMLRSMEAGQPHWLASSVGWGASAMQSHQGLYNTLAALVQVGIGLGILYRPTAKPALLVSFVWAFVVWWSGEAFGMLFMNMAVPLTGAPGAVLLYALIGAIVWPNDRPGGLLGVLGSRLAWAGLWLAMAWLWLLAPSSAQNAVHAAITNAPSGMGWLTHLQTIAARLTDGAGLGLALVMAVLSAAIGIAVLLNRRAKAFLAVSVALSLIFWLIGQGLGGIFAGGATDPNAGPLFILLACALYSLVPFEQRLGPVTRPRPVA